MSRTQRTAVIVVIVAAGAVLWWMYARHAARVPSTRDAYVGASVVDIAAQVSGPVSRLAVVDNQYVSKGDLLFEIERRPFEIAVASASASVAEADQSVKALADEVGASLANIEAAQAALVLARQNRDRVAPLAADGAVPQQQLDEAESQLRSSQANLEAAAASSAEARDQLGSAGPDNPQIRAAVASYEKALLDLSFTRVTAPADGWITNLQLQEGSFVGAGSPVVTLVEDGSWRVWAYMREDQLERIQAGQPASFELPAYPGRRFEGRVQGIAWGITQGNAAGPGQIPQVSPTVAWVRLAQRFPVRVDVPEPDPAYPLRIGMTATVWIDTTVPPDSGSGE